MLALLLQVARHKRNEDVRENGRHIQRDQAHHNIMLRLGRQELPCRLLPAHVLEGEWGSRGVHDVAVAKEEGAVRAVVVVVCHAGLPAVEGLVIQVGRVCV